MIIDVSGVELTPGRRGKDCLGNGQHFDKTGERIEFCCEECDYFLCCVREHTMRECVEFCNHQECPRWHFIKPNRFVLFLWLQWDRILERFDRKAEKRNGCC